MTKNPAYIIPLFGLYFFTFGYVYEWGYLWGFNVENQVVNHNYAEFLVLATHALTVALRSGWAIFLIFFLSIIFGAYFSVSKLENVKKWVEKHRPPFSEKNRFFCNFLLISFSPICLVTLFLIPGFLGHFEALALKKHSEKYWQEIELKSSPPVKIEGVTIRKISGSVLFYQKNDPIVHVISSGDILATRYRTSSHNNTPWGGPLVKFNY